MLGPSLLYNMIPKLYISKGLQVCFSPTCLSENLKMPLSKDNTLTWTRVRWGDLGTRPYGNREESKVSTGPWGKWDWGCPSTQDLLRAIICRIFWRQPARDKHGNTVISSWPVKLSQSTLLSLQFFTKFRKLKTNYKTNQSQLLQEPKAHPSVFLQRAGCRWSGKVPPKQTSWQAQNALVLIKETGRLIT